MEKRKDKKLERPPCYTKEQFDEYANLIIKLQGQDSIKVKLIRIIQVSWRLLSNIYHIMS